MPRRTRDHVLTARQRAADLIRARTARLEETVAAAHVAREDYTEALDAAEAARVQLHALLREVLEFPGITTADVVELCEVDEAEVRAATRGGRNGRAARIEQPVATPVQDAADPSDVGIRNGAAADPGAVSPAGAAAT